MYIMNIEYINKEDGTKTEATTKGKQIEELLHDIIFFLSKKEYYCRKCNKKHELQIKNITINFIKENF